jgi:hypothetical protein
VASPKIVALTVKDTAELEATIDTYTSQGYLIARESDSDALLSRPMRIRRWWFVLVLIPGITPTPESEYVDVRVGATPQEAFHPVSEDGKWWWDGEHWLSTTRTIPPDAQISIDALTWWTGHEWQPAPMPLHRWRSPDYTPGSIPSLGPPATRVLRTQHIPFLVGLAVSLFLIGLGIVGILTAIWALLLAFPLAIVVVVVTIKSPPPITIDARGLSCKSRFRNITVPFSAVSKVKADETDTLVSFEAPGASWSWRLGKKSERIALIQAKWFGWTADYLAAAIDEMARCRSE